MPAGVMMSFWLPHSLIFVIAVCVCVYTCVLILYFACVHLGTALKIPLCPCDGDGCDQQDAITSKSEVPRCSRVASEILHRETKQKQVGHRRQAGLSKANLCLYLPNLSAKYFQNFLIKKLHA